MNRLSDTTEATVKVFIDGVLNAFGDDLESVILYGAVARGEESKHTHLSFLVTVHDNTPSELARCAHLVKGWNKKHIATPLFLTREYIGRSLDTFPLEFMSMKAAYHTVYGDDILESLTFEREHIRSQCERELKGKLIHLRAEYLTLRGNAKGLRDLVVRSLDTFRLVFTGVLYLKDIEVPLQSASMLDAVTAEYGLDPAVFAKLSAAAKGSVKLSDTETDVLFDRYIEQLDSLAKAVDDIEDLLSDAQPHMPDD